MRPIKAVCILHTKPVIAARNWRTEKTLWTLQESPTKLLIWVHFNGRYFTVLLSCFSATEELKREMRKSQQLLAQHVELQTAVRRSMQNEMPSPTSKDHSRAISSQNWERKRLMKQMPLLNLLGSFPKWSFCLWKWGFFLGKSILFELTVFAHLPLENYAFQDRYWKWFRTWFLEWFLSSFYY